MYLLVYTKDFEEQMEKQIKSGNKILCKKIYAFIEEIEENPTTGSGKPEALKGFGDRMVYSRRIDKKHRLTYEIFEEEKRVELLACYGHYDDK